MSEAPSQFFYASCQVGAEAALKEEVGRRHPLWSSAYSRRGFVTFKVPDTKLTADNLPRDLLFARRSGSSLGNVTGADARQLATEVWKLAEDEHFDHLHVWQRDSAVVGDNGFEPSTTPLAETVGECLTEAAAYQQLETKPPLNQQARKGDRVLDCVIVEPGEWWIGWHTVKESQEGWIGGVPELVRPPEMISRAYLKMAEALAWSGLPMRHNDVAVEIGAAPGGACQLMLDRGLYVIGIDPAEIEEAVLKHPRFRHIRRRGRDVRKMEFNEVNWIAVDSNVAPTHTLDTLEGIVTHPTVKVKGLVITLKLLEWSLATDAPLWLDRIRQWGFGVVKARQLAFGRQEICVVAQRSLAMRKRAKRPLKKDHQRPAGE